MKLFKLLFISLILSSCFFEPHRPTQTELKQTMTGARYDTSILNKISIYQALGQVLSKNSDTIVALTDSRLHQIDTSAIGQYCFEYYYNSVAQNTNIKDMPDFVYKQVDSCWRKIGKDNIAAIRICNDRTVILNVLMNKSQNNTLIVHQLIWSMQPFSNNYSFNLFKDTLLTKNCTYPLGVSQDFSGW